MLRVRERRVKNNAKVIGLRKQTNEMLAVEMRKVWVMSE